MDIAKYIDHTLLKPDSTESQIQKVIEEALQFNFAGVCVNSYYLTTVAQGLKNSKVLPVAVIGFPLGAMNTQSKFYEAEWVVKNGAKEVDMVINIGALKDKNIQFVTEDIKQVVLASKGAKVKVIIETALLTEEEKVLACKASLEAGAHFVKTCTGFSGGGATVKDIELMKSLVENKMQIKASGGIKTKDFALELIAAGAHRLGTSSGVALIQSGQSVGDY